MTSYIMTAERPVPGCDPLAHCAAGVGDALFASLSCSKPSARSSLSLLLCCIGCFCSADLRRSTVARWPCSSRGAGQGEQERQFVQRAASAE